MRHEPVRGTGYYSHLVLYTMVMFSNTFPSAAEEREGIDQDFGLKLILALSTSRRSSHRTHPSKGLHRQSETMRADSRARRDRAPKIWCRLARRYASTPWLRTRISKSVIELLLVGDTLKSS